MAAEVLAFVITSSTRGFVLLWDQDTSDAKRERKFLNKLGWGYCILDEGHSIKNAGSKRYKRLSQLECTSKLLLTGTPIQNNTTEIFSILHFLLPKLFTLERLEQLQEVTSQPKQTECLLCRVCSAAALSVRHDTVVIRCIVSSVGLAVFQS